MYVLFTRNVSSLSQKTCPKLNVFGELWWVLAGFSKLRRVLAGFGELWRDLAGSSGLMRAVSVLWRVLTRHAILPAHLGPHLPGWKFILLIRAQLFK